MEIQNVIIRKPISEEQRMTGIAMMLQLYPKISRMNELAKKLDLKTASIAEIAECFNIAAYSERCAITLGFRNLQDMLHFIAIYGIESLCGG